MTYMYLVFIVIVLCFPGVWLMSKHTAKLLASKPDQRLTEKAAFALSMLQMLIIAALCAAAGAYFAPKTGLADPFLQGLAEGRFEFAELAAQIGIGAAAGTVCALVWVASYYGYVRPRLDADSVRISERLRFQLGLRARIASGGIVEEVIFRWGMLSLAMWLLMKASLSEPAAFWIGLAVTGTLFGLAHLPGNVQEGCKPTPLFVGTSVFGNLWVSLFCGVFLWQFGLISAMTVHILFHVIWYPWDRAAVRLEPKELTGP